MGPGLKPMYVRSWNKSIDDLAEEGGVEAALKKLFHFSNRYRLLQNVLFAAACQLSDSHPFLSVKDVTAACASQTCDAKTQQLQGLSVLQLQLLLAVKYVDKIYQGQPCNFEMAFSEYAKQMRTGSMQKFDRLIALKAMEHLETLELLRAVQGTQTAKMQREYVFYHLLVTAEQLREALNKATHLPTEVKQWADTCL